MNSIEEKEGKAEAQCYYYNLGQVESIEDIFFVTSRDMMVVSKKRIYMFNIQTHQKIFVGKQIYYVGDAVTENNISKQWYIKNAYFCEIHKMYYMILFKSYKEYRIMRFEIEENKLIREKVQDISQAFEDFEISTKEPNIVFLITRLGILKFDFNYNNGQDDKKKEKMTKLEMRRKKRMKTQEKKYNEDGTRLFFKIKGKEIHFIKFTPNMKFFYTHSGKVLQKYLTDGCLLVKSFHEHDTSIRNMIFDRDLPYMFTYIFLFHNFINSCQ